MLSTRCCSASPHLMFPQQAATCTGVGDDWLCMQASKGAFSAYAYETLPIMHTLMSQSGLEAEQFSSDCFTFFDGYGGHINAAMREWTGNIRAGLHGVEAAVDSDAAHALIKVSFGPLLAPGTLETMHHSCICTSA